MHMLDFNHAKRLLLSFYRERKIPTKENEFTPQSTLKYKILKFY